MRGLYLQWILHWGRKFILGTKSADKELVFSWCKVCYWIANYPRQKRYWQKALTDKQRDKLQRVLQRLFEWRAILLAVDNGTLDVFCEMLLFSLVFKPRNVYIFDKYNMRQNVGKFMNIKEVLLSFYWYLSRNFQVISLSISNVFYLCFQMQNDTVGPPPPDG